MRTNLPVTQQEYAYPAHTMLVSSTDTKGYITHCNSAFVSVSGFTHDELIGQNHNMIRHPDMPAEAFRDMWDAWKAGDRKKATESIPDEVLDALIVNGSPEECAEHVKKYAANGVTTPMPMMLASPDDTMKVLRALAPSA